MAKQGFYGNPKTGKPLIYPAVKGRQVRCGNRQSMPSSSIANCAGVSAILPSFAAGQTNRHFSNRFKNKHAPCPSHQMILIRSPCRPRKTNIWPLKGFCCVVCSACAATHCVALNRHHLGVRTRCRQSPVHQHSRGRHRPDLVDQRSRLAAITIRHHRNRLQPVDRSVAIAVIGNRAFTRPHTTVSCQSPLTLPPGIILRPPPVVQFTGSQIKTTRPRFCAIQSQPRAPLSPTAAPTPGRSRLARLAPLARSCGITACSRTALRARSPAMGSACPAPKPANISKVCFAPDIRLAEQSLLPHLRQIIGCGRVPFGEHVFPLFRKLPIAIGIKEQHPIASPGPGPGRAML